ncbi:MAG TPA: nuclear transport factor 2 family protein [Hyphomicrobiales bacterium]|nr:nuclear transport factor 2 family protein [Hyphomicrobiales bacterium]
MPITPTPHFHPARFVRRCTATALLLLPLALPVSAQQVTLETLLDRIQVEDFLTRYYYDLSEGESHALSEYFTEDALLDVDGTIAHGHAEIAALYTRPEGEAEPEPNAAYRRGHMLLTNPVIEVNGDRAVAHVIWTGVMNEGVGKAPSLFEQGREDTELVKVNGKWLISKRYISSDSGLPDRFDATYEPRGNPLKEAP